MNKYKQLIKNVGFLTIGSLASKILSFLLVPLYTTVLSTQEYGIYDIIVTTISLLLPILSINIIEAVLRFPIEKTNDSDYVSDVFTVGIRFTLISCLILFIFLVANRFFSLVSIIIPYDFYMFLLFAVQSINQLFMCFARSVNHIKEVSIAGVISSVVMIGLNILFLLYYKMGLDGFFIAVIVSNVVANIYYLYALKIHRYIKIKLINERITREMLLYSFPLIFNTVGWWVNNASDRYIVTLFCSVSENGIYSVAYKVPTILNVFHAIFTQAWIISAVQEYKSDGNSAFFRNVYNAYGGFLMVMCSVLILLNKPISHILFQKEFYIAWKYTPWLLMAVVFGALSGVLGGVFSAEKNSKMFAMSTCIGSAVNVILNLVLVNIIGPLGAAIATMISAYVVLVFRIVHTQKILKMNLKLVRDHIIFMFLMIQCILDLIIKNMYIYYSISTALLLIILYLYHNEIRVLYKKIVYILKNKGEINH